MSRQKDQKVSGRRTLADFLTKVKESTGKTDAQIGREIGTSSANVRRWRLGLTIPPAPTVSHIATVYGTTAEELGAGNGPVDGSGILVALTGKKKRSMELLDQLLRTGDDSLTDHLVRQIELLTDLNRRRH